MVEELRSDILSLQNAIKSLERRGLKRKTILILLSHLTKLPQKTIKTVINGIDHIEEQYLNKKEL